MSKYYTPNRAVSSLMGAIMTPQLACQYSWVGKGTKLNFSGLSLQFFIVNSLKQHYPSGPAHPPQIDAITAKLQEWLKHQTQVAQKAFYKSTSVFKTVVPDSEVCEKWVEYTSVTCCVNHPQKVQPQLYSDFVIPLTPDASFTSAFNASSSNVDCSTPVTPEVRQSQRRNHDSPIVDSPNVDGSEVQDQEDRIASSQLAAAAAPEAEDASIDK